MAVSALLAIIKNVKNQKFDNVAQSAAEIFKMAAVSHVGFAVG